MNTGHSRQKKAKTRSFMIFAPAKSVYPASLPVSVLNEHFERFFNTEYPNGIVFTQPRAKVSI